MEQKGLSGTKAPLCPLFSFCGKRLSSPRPSLSSKQQTPYGVFSPSLKILWAPATHSLPLPLSPGDHSSFYCLHSFAFSSIKRFNSLNKVASEQRPPSEQSEKFYNS